MPPTARSCRIRATLVITLLAMNTGALAQTCADPIPLPANRPLLFDSCRAPNSIPYHYFPGGQGFPSDSRDVVYVFDEPGRPGIPGVPQPLPRPRTLSVTVQPSTFGFPADVVVMKGECDYTRFPYAHASGDGDPVVLPDAKFSPGERYYIVVTGDMSGPPTCGFFTILRNELGPPPRGG